MIDALAMIFPLIFTSNLVISVVKYLGDQSLTKTHLRLALAALSLVGVISTAALTGDPVNFDSVSSLAMMLLDALIVAFGAHFSYKVIKYA